MEEPAPSSTVKRLARSARSMSGWLRFMGVMTILTAIPAVLSVFGIVFAWIPIWLGVLLFRAGMAARRGSDDELIRMIERLRLYFVVQSVVLIVLIIVFALSFAFFGSIMFEMMREIGSQGPTWEA